MELYYAVLVVAFVAGLLAVESLYGFWNATHGPEASRIARRLRLMSAAGHDDQAVSVFKQRQLAKAAGLERLLLKLPRVHELDRLLLQARSNLSVASLFALMGALFLAGFLAGWYFMAAWVAGLLIGAGCGMFPVLMMIRAKHKRTHTILRQLPDAMDLLTRAMRAGHAFSGGLKMVADETAEPLAGEFRIAFDEINYGLSLEAAMQNLGARVAVPDIKYFVIAVLIHRETGGNLTAILEKIATMIRERLKLLWRVRVLAAQGRLSAWIMSLLPFFVAAILVMIQPQLIQVLWTEEAGKVMLMTAGAMMAVGIFIMWRMVRIRI